MPTYSYRCTECGTAFDIQQAFTDATLTECPTCSGKLRKLFNTVGVTFNGSGFYRTDSRAAAKESGSSSSNASPAPKKEAAPAAAAVGSSSGSSAASGSGSSGSASS